MLECPHCAATQIRPPELHLSSVNMKRTVKCIFKTDETKCYPTSRNKNLHFNMEFYEFGLNRLGNILFKKVEKNNT